MGKHKESALRHCTYCDKQFVSLLSLDLHRVGVKPHKRCLNADELAAAEWRIGEHAEWLLPAAPAAYKRFLVGRQRWAISELSSVSSTV